jgi:thioredoxin-related protein
MIKKLIFAVALLASSAFALELVSAYNYASAVQVAKKDNKNILLMLSQPGCPACNYMKSVSLKNDEVVGALKNFVFVEVNIHKDEWNKKYRAFGTPTFYLLDKNENKLGRPVVGGLEPADFAQVIKEIESGKK